MAKESEGKRGLSHSERDCGDEKLRRLFLLGFEDEEDDDDDDSDEVDMLLDMAGILRKRRGFRGIERKGQLVVVGVLWDLEGVKRTQTESAVSKRSGKEGRLRLRFVSGSNGGDISISNEVCVVAVVSNVLMMGYVHDYGLGRRK